MKTKGVARMRVKAMCINDWWATWCATLLLLVMGGCVGADEKGAIGGDENLEKSRQAIEARGAPVRIEGGGHHSLAVRQDGTVWAWGYNAYGQVGDGTASNRLSPVQVPGLTGAVSVAGGVYHSLALKSDGTVWSWGYNSYGNLGDNTTINRYIPVQVLNLTGVIWIFCS